MSDELAYSLFLIFSVIAGVNVQRLSSPSHRKQICALIGVCSSVFFCKHDCLYGLMSTFVCAALLKLNIYPIKIYRRPIFFILGFGFLTLFRVAHLIGLPKPCALANAAQLVLTLKIIGIAGELSETQLRRVPSSQRYSKVAGGESDSSSRLQSIYRDVDPSFLDIICYFYSYAGYYTGPYFTFRTFNDAMEGVYSVSRVGFCSLSAFCRKTMIDLLLQTAFCGALYFALVKLFPLEYIWSVDWSLNSMAYRLIYLIPVFTWFRLRFYSAWLASEAALTSLRIGVYPSASEPEPGAGPVNLSALDQLCTGCVDEKSTEVCLCDSTGNPCKFWSTECIHNIAIFECECSPTVAGKLRAWNRTVQYWLAVNVYQRVPRSLPRPIRAFTTVFVSAYWHGLHAGYYLSFGTAGALLSAEKIIPRLIAVVRSFSPQNNPALTIPRSPEKESANGGFLFYLFGKAKYFVSAYLTGFWSMRAFEYMAIGFYALTFADTTRIWQDVFFVQHIIAAILILASFVVTPARVTKVHD